MSPRSQPVRRGGPFKQVKRSHEETYRLYRVLAGLQGGRHVAVAYEGRKRAFMAAGQNLSDAIAQVKVEIDRRLAGKADGSVGKLDRSAYTSALNLSMADRSKAEWHLLHRIGRLSASSLTLPQLRAGGDFDDAALDRALIRIGRRIAKALGLSLPAGSANAPHARSIVLARDEPEADAITFHEPFVMAVRDHIRT